MAPGLKTFPDPVPRGQRVIAIDPGASGGMAVFPPGGVPLVWKMPETEVDVLAWAVANLRPGDTVALEKVGGYIGRANNDGTVGQPGSAMFNFGMGYGGLRMAVLATTGRLPLDVRPQEWQGGLGVEPRRSIRKGRQKKWTESQTQFKNRLKELAAGLFPGLKITLAVCDALLLGEYVRRGKLHLPEVT